MAYNDASYPLLLVLYDQSYIVLWDTERELLVWKKDFLKETNGEKFCGFSVDPFTESSITCESPSTPKKATVIQFLSPTVHCNHCMFQSCRPTTFGWWMIYHRRERLKRPFKRWS